MSISLTTLLEGDRRPRVLLVGDVMLDRYVWGDVERISPEAPIPILRIERQEHRLGGAGSVASMLAALGAQTILASVVGDDDEGRIVAALLDNLEINRRLVLTVDDRATTVKQRLLGRAQHRYPHQMMRVDRESVAPISAETVDRLLSGIARCMDEIDLVLVSDYNKGVCKGQMFPRLIELARAAGVPVVADPVKDADYRRYAGCTCITPNRAEAGRALGIRITTPQEGLDAARKLLRIRRCNRSSSRSIGTAWPGSIATAARSSSPPDRGRSATSPARATWSSRCWATCWRPARTRRRPSKWPTSPAAWKWNGWASCP